MLSKPNPLLVHFSIATVSLAQCGRSVVRAWVRRCGFLCLWINIWNEHRSWSSTGSKLGCWWAPASLPQAALLRLHYLGSSHPLPQGRRWQFLGARHADKGRWAPRQVTLLALFPLSLQMQIPYGISADGRSLGSPGNTRAEPPEWRGQKRVCKAAAADSGPWQDVQGAHLRKLR